jgi:uncharacterized membrane protein
MSSKKCLKCGFVSFAAAETCKRCGAKLSSSAVAAPSPSPPRQVTNKRRSPLIIYIVGGFLSLILGALAFAATAERGTALPLGLFTAVFVGGMVLVIIIASYLLKTERNVEARPSSKTGKNYLRVVIYMLASFILVLPLFLLKLNPNLPSEMMAEKIGELVGACLVPAIITAIWMRFSKEEWSWMGVGLRYILLFFIFAFSVVLRMVFDKG